MAAVMDLLIVYVMLFSLPKFVEPDAAGRGILFSYDIEFQCRFVLDDYNFHLYAYIKFIH